jgi:hypothetical protein
MPTPSRGREAARIDQGQEENSGSLGKQAR